LYKIFEVAEIIFLYGTVIY